MKDGYFLNVRGEKVVQPMVFPDGPSKGLAKGLRQVCSERFGPESIKGKKQDDLGKFACYISFITFFLFCFSVKMLENEPDFMDQKPLLVEAVEAVGGKVLFGTKFHPELMPIENAYR